MPHARPGDRSVTAHGHRQVLSVRAENEMGQRITRSAADTLSIAIHPSRLKKEPPSEARLRFISRFFVPTRISAFAVTLHSRTFPRESKMGWICDPIPGTCPTAGRYQVSSSTTLGRIRELALPSMTGLSDRSPIWTPLPS